jgi:hypothetical protein
MIDELLADELKAVGGIVWISLEMSRDLIDNKCIFCEEFGPGVLGVRGIQVTKQGFQRRSGHLQSGS